jgi:hypothetical protein
MEYLGQLVREVLGSEVPASTASLHFVASDADGKRPSPNHNAYELQQPVDGDGQVELVLRYLQEDLPPRKVHFKEGQGASSSKAGLPLSSPPTTQQMDLDELLEAKSCFGN